MHGFSQPARAHADVAGTSADGEKIGDEDKNEPTATTSANLFGLYGALIDADDQADAQVLARLGWTLFTMASEAQQARYGVTHLLDEVLIAARAAAAGHGSPAALAILCQVLGRHGWLPPAKATPLQMLAAPAPHAHDRGYEAC